VEQISVRATDGSRRSRTKASETPHVSGGREREEYKNTKFVQSSLLLSDDVQEPAGRRSRDIPAPKNTDGYIGTELVYRARDVDRRHMTQVIKKSSGDGINEAGMSNKYGRNERETDRSESMISIDGRSQTSKHVDDRRSGLEDKIERIACIMGKIQMSGRKFDIET
jgi:hypothetical protein